MINLSLPGAAFDRIRRKRHEVLRGSVVVITGASSGIGRATARAFAGAGARLVLAARNEPGLQRTAASCSACGARALVVPTDVSDATATRNLAESAINAFGRIDVWINNAGVGLFGPFANTDLALHRRVVETNLFGTMNGTAAVLPYFLRQGHGTLITNISVGGFIPVPFAAAYTASKFGMRGFMASLRQEVAHEPNVHVCSVFPAAVDTPGFHHGANVSGAALEPRPPIFSPEKVAAAMVSLALHPRDELPVGWPSRLARVGYGLAPATTEHAVGATFRRYLHHAPLASSREGNLFNPSAEPLTAHGGWKRRQSGRARLQLPALAAFAVAGIAWLTVTRKRRAALEPPVRWAQPV